MSKIRTIYLYLVCLITLFMAVGGFISGVNYLAKYFFPTSYYYNSSYDYDYDYKNSYNDSEEVQKQNDKIRNLKSAINSFALLVVSAPIFVYHWKKIEIERKEMEV